MWKRYGIYRCRKLFKDVYQIRNCDVNVYFFVGSEKALLFDTGFGFDSLVPLLKKLTDKPFEVVLSHGHYDHCGGAGEFEKVYIHPADREVVERHTSLPYWKQALKKGQEVNKRPFTRVFPEGFIEEKYLNKPECEYLNIRENDEFDLGGMSLRCIELPGHTPGSIGLYWKENKCIFTSDAVNGYMYLFLKESLDLAAYRKTLYKLDKLDFRYMVQGHSNSIYLRKALKDYIEVAENPDWKHGKAMQPSLTTEPDAVIRLVKSRVHPKLSAKLAVSEDRLSEKEKL